MSLLASRAAASCTIDLSTAVLTLDERTGAASLKFADGTPWPTSKEPAFLLEVDGKSHQPQSVELANDRLVVRFANRARAEFAVIRGRGFAFFRLSRLDSPGEVTRFRLF
ncbi:MAG: hypothetical protein WCS99_18200, partial [Limisphaerales bacterium]